MTAAFSRLISLCLICLCIQLQAQEESIIDAFSKYHSSTPVEKVYLHTDKEVYVPGETLWFGAYLVEGSLHGVSKLSEVTYVDLLDSAGQSLVQLSLKMVNGIGNGDISLGDTLAMGQYTIRGYTHYQRNFDPGFIFSKSIFLVDSEVDEAQQAVSTNSAKYDFQYFPEGGDLVAGQSSAVAFKATDERGTGVYVEGELVTKSGTVVSTFKSQHLGMGRFLFIPVKGEAYEFKYKINDKEFSLPVKKPLSEGSRLSVRQAATSFTITGSTSPGFDINDCLIMGHVRGQIYLMARPEAGRDFIYAKVPHNRMPNGIIHLTMFQKGVPVQERLIFNENSVLLPQVTFIAEQLKRRDKASFEITVSDTEGAPINGKVSMSILEEAIPENQININSYLNLFSDLKGVVENPASYFDPENSNRKTHLDLLMMTQGWRRFVWTDVLDNSIPDINYYAEKGFSVEGQVVDYYKRDKPRPGMVSLNFLENLLFKQEIETDESGNFYFDGLDIQDSVSVMVQAMRKGKKGKVKRETNAFVKISQPDSLPYRQTLLTRFGTNDDEKFAEILSDVEEFTYKTDDVIELDEFVISANTLTNTNDDPFKRPNMLHGQPQSRMVMDSVPGGETFTNVFDMINGRLAGVQIRGTGPDRNAFIRGTQATLMVDGITTTNDYVDLMDPRSVAFVDVIGGIQASVYGVSGAIVAIYTREGYVAEGEEDQHGLIVFQHPGYYQAREFYTPNYDEMTTEEALAKDLRTTQYWSSVRQLQDGKTQIAYTVSDDVGDFVIYLEGITDDGESFTGQYRFQVSDF